MNIDRTGLVTIIAVVALLLGVMTYVVPGKQGLQGPQGVSGEPGPRGVAGVSGPMGPQGVPGVQGVLGPMGPQGATGTQGLQGEKGDSGTLHITGDHILATMSSPDVVAFLDDKITVIGAAFFHDPEIWLFDSDGDWFELGTATRNHANNTFQLRVKIPSAASIGVGEICAKKPDGKGTYITFPIMIED